MKRWLPQIRAGEKASKRDSWCLDPFRSVKELKGHTRIHPKYHLTAHARDQVKTYINEKSTDRTKININENYIDILILVLFFEKLNK